MKLESRTLMASMKANPFASLLVLVFLVSAGLAIASVVRIAMDANKDQAFLQLVADLRVQAYRVGSLARDATSGNQEAFSELGKVTQSMEASWTALSKGDSVRVPMGGLTKEVGHATPELTTYDGIWNRLRNNSQIITTNRETIVFLNDVANTLNKSLPEVQQEHNNIVEVLLDNRAPADQVSVAQMQSWRAERIGRNVDKMLRGGTDADVAADQFNRDANLFSKVLTGMKNGDVTLGISRVTDTEARTSLEEITELTDFVSSSVSDIFKASPALFKARTATQGIEADLPQLLETLSSLAALVDELPSQRPWNNFFALLLAGVATVSLLFIGGLQITATKRRFQEQSDANERNQMAILRLLDELADLADGDLTTTATVTEDFTGAIADSINFTIDQLRVLVSRINETAERVAMAAQETQATALHLAEASEHQAQEIAGASAAVNEMAVTIDQVSANAAESASVAERSVAIASKGSKVVQNTIQGMDTIREQIQDTSKRIKRLGESSQEIGDIVSLINDIADQTNILALNAAIQASMAGDAGRGFAVVADEVQRLAERSAAATKQIEALVKTIQNDTNEAVSSMEATTSEVVSGARLAQDAGVALEEIENVSTNLAELIQNISNAARQQASSAGHISNTMNVIQEITSQTSAGTSATARSIGDLSSMAQDLKESVLGFKLPEEAEEEMEEELLAMDEGDVEETDIAEVAEADDSLPEDLEDGLLEIGDDDHDELSLDVEGEGFASAEVDGYEEESLDLDSSEEIVELSEFAVEEDDPDRNQATV
ncbi:MAG: methyl-accepting chemotaxis protein [Cellvibrionaceae bacterium]